MSTISPVTGALPQQPAPTSTNCATPPPALAATPTAAATQPAVVQPDTAGGGAVQAAQGAINVAPEQLVPVLQQLVAVLTDLVAVLQQQGGGAVTGGGAPAQVGQCGMAGCSMDHATPVQGSGGANAAPSDPEQSSSHAGSTTQSGAGAAPATAGNVDPASVKDKTGTGGLNGAALRGLDEAHRFGLPLVSGKRSGGGKSDHDHGNAIDVGTLPIGSPSSTGGTPQMKAFAEYMRQQGKAGKLGVKYVIADGKIASARNNWEWREYTYPGKTASELERLKQSDRGEFNRIQHYDHVHVSFS